MTQNAGDRVEDIGNQLEQLNDCLNDLKEKLNNCETVKEVSQVAVEFVREKLESQAAFIFLFDKDGLLTRVAIKGEDSAGIPIADDWLYGYDEKLGKEKAEHYKPGESLSGKRVPDIGHDKGFAVSLYSNNLQRDYGDSCQYKYGKEYSEKLGDLKSGISVPLNGFSRTFGSLDVMNKRDAKELTEFTEKDVYFLMLISTLVASHISSIRRQHRKKIYGKLTDWLFKSSSKSVKFKEVCEYLAKELIAETTPYKVCIIRRVNDDGFFEDLAKKSTPDITWEGRMPGSPKVDQELNTIGGKVYREKKPKYVENIPEAIEAIKKGLHEFTFYNLEWLERTNLKSIAVLPLTVEGHNVGTINVSIGYEHKFSEGNKAFLENVAHILASILSANKSKKELMEQKSELVAISQQVGRDSAMNSFLHNYKNELIQFSLILSQLSSQSNKSNKVKEQMIYERQQWVKLRIEEIKQEFQGNNQDLNLLNVNQKIKEIINLLLTDEPDIDLEESYDSNIPEIEVKSSEIEAVIYNLINNAIIAVNNAMQKPKRLTIATNLVTISRIDYIEILVQDNGNGIPNEISDQVFNKGFSTRKEQGGTGMGLFIAKDVIDNYGGKITFESKVGQGTTFKVHIPYKRYVP